MARYAARSYLALALTLALVGSARGQQANIETPLVSGNHSFHENIGLSWGLAGDGWFFRFGGGPSPAFGGFDPSSGARLGGGFRSGDVSGFFNLSAGQGSDSFLGSQSASVTVPSGGFGLVSDAIQRPFVMGFVPVVGSEYFTPLEERLSRIRAQGGFEPLSQVESPVVGGGGVSRSASDSSRAERGDASVAEIRAAQAAEDASAGAEIESLVAKGAAQEAAGKLGVARVYYQQALRRASGSRRDELQAKVRAIDELRRKKH